MRTEPTMGEWNPVAQTIKPNPDVAAAYDELFALYLETYENTKRVVHELARLQRTERSTK